MAVGQKHVPRPLLEMGVVASVLPDLDVIGFALGIPYESQWGHRGFSHSIAFALVFAALCAWRCELFKAKRWTVFAFIFVSTLSHGLLDALTDGGHGIAFFWPFSAERHFFDVQPIPVSPIGPSFFSRYGLFVFLSEIGMIWAPCLVIGGAGWLVRKRWVGKKG